MVTEYDPAALRIAFVWVLKTCKGLISVNLVIRGVVVDKVKSAGTLHLHLHVLLRLHLKVFTVGEIR